MKKHRSKNALLVELLIVVLFFVLTSAVLLEMFAGAHTLSERAEYQMKALSEAQNTADMLYCRSCSEDTLEELMFTESNGAWEKDYGHYILRVSLAQEMENESIMILSSVSIFDAAGKELACLPCSRYCGGNRP